MLTSKGFQLFGVVREPSTTNTLYSSSKSEVGRQRLHPTSSKVLALKLGHIKSIPDPDMMNSLINNLRILAPGLTKMQNQNKDAKRKKNKD